MNSKSIFSLISFFLLSMFYVAPASAGPTYINIEVPKECGAWENAGGAHHCWALNTNHGKAGKRASFKCSGKAGNGKGVFVITTGSCGMVVFSHASGNESGTWHTVTVSQGEGACISKSCISTRRNTLKFRVCKPGEYGPRCVKRNKQKKPPARHPHDIKPVHNWD
jgi:hypothetical protein